MVTAKLRLHLPSSTDYARLVGFEACFHFENPCFNAMKFSIMIIEGTGVKRAESLRVVGQSGPGSLTATDNGSKLKRNPSFTTRKRTSSLRKVKRMENPEDLPPVEMSGFLDRKHEQQSGGKRAAIRSWKSFYTGKIYYNETRFIQRSSLIWIYLFFFFKWTMFSFVWTTSLFLQRARRLPREQSCRFTIELVSSGLWGTQQLNFMINFQLSS